MMTSQLPDRILMDGEWMDLFSNPLEQYWIDSGKKRPAFCQQFNCKRGYVASWEIKNSQLLLKDVVGNFEKLTFLFAKKTAPYSLSKLFPKSRNRIVRAVWYSGKLRIPKGKMVYYDHKEYDSRFEKEQIITVYKGNIMKIVTMDCVHHELTVDADWTLKSV
jgi:predicted small secreted protein